MTLKEALKVIIEDEFLEDSIYEVRDRADGERTPEEEGLNRWELPRVKRFAEACRVLKQSYESML